MVLDLSWGNPKYVFRRGAELLESSPGEKDLGVLVDEQLNMSQLCALAAQKVSWAPSEEEGEGGNCPSLPCPYEAPFRADAPGLEKAQRMWKCWNRCRGGP